jgi:hypothetical protein
LPGFNFREEQLFSLSPASRPAQVHTQSPVQWVSCVGSHPTLRYVTLRLHILEMNLIIDLTFLLQREFNEQIMEVSGTESRSERHRNIIYLNIILRSMPRSSNRSHPLRFSGHDFLFISDLSNACQSHYLSMHTANFSSSEFVIISHF